MILVMRTDKPEAEIGLFENSKKIDYMTWTAHRQLADTIHAKIKELLDGQGKGLADLSGVVAYKGPGSFTGLRIGLSVANALAYGLDIPIIAADGQDWVKSGLAKLEAGQNDKLAMPEYGAPANITTPRK